MYMLILINQSNTKYIIPTYFRVKLWYEHWALSRSLMSLMADIFFSASEKKCFLFTLCMIISNNVQLEDDKLSILCIIIILFPTASRPRLLHPLPALCGTSRLFLYLIFFQPDTLYTLCIGMYCMSMLSWHVHRQVLKLSWWVRHLCYVDLTPSTPADD